MYLTVKELKEKLKNVPDDYIVKTEAYFAAGSWWHMVYSTEEIDNKYFLLKVKEAE